MIVQFETLGRTHIHDVGITYLTLYSNTLTIKGINPTGRNENILVECKLYREITFDDTILEPFINDFHNGFYTHRESNYTTIDIFIRASKKYIAQLNDGLV